MTAPFKFESANLKWLLTLWAAFLVAAAEKIITQFQLYTCS